ncbi:MAG: hypothetical protein ACREPE_13510, partial [Lysobacter sp.]
GQSLVGHYEPRSEDAWAWFLPTVMPTLSLIVAVLAADYRVEPTADEKPMATVDRRMLRLAVGLSSIYLLLVALSILIQPFLSTTAPLVLMQRSNLWLGPMQGLVAATLGVFFQSRR